MIYVINRGTWVSAYKKVEGSEDAGGGVSVSRLGARLGGGGGGGRTVFLFRVGLFSVTLGPK